MALTNDAGLAHQMTLLRSHGITRDAVEMTQPPDGGWYYQQIDLGFNYRMTELQAALGLSQMERLDVYVARRHDLALRYDHLLKDLPVQIPHRADYSYSAFHLYIILINGNVGVDRAKVFDALRSHGIGVNVHYIPMHTQPYYAQLGLHVGYHAESFPEANYYYARAISIPLYPTLSDAQQEDVVRVLSKALA